MWYNFLAKKGVGILKKLYAKSELWFSLVWIIAYVVLFSLADSISSGLGVEKLITAPLAAALTAFLLVWLKRSDMFAKYGLTKVAVDHKRYLYYLPLLVLISTNLWGGFALRLSPIETVLYVISMIGVGILEEVIFRGFLFKALCKDSFKTAVIISSVTFGIGHIVNLLNGADFLPTLLQIVYATAAGFLFTILVHRSGTLLPCIITHSAINSLSAFGAERSPALDLITAAVLTILSLLYAWWILKKTKT